MPFENSLSFKGLQTSPNNLGAGSEGALVVADNVTIRYPDVLEPRRGQESVPVNGLTSPIVMQATYTGSQYDVVTGQPHGYVNGQTVNVGLSGTSGAYLTAPITVTSTTSFYVVSAKWPLDASQSGVFISFYASTWSNDLPLTFPVSQVAFFQDNVLLHSEAIDKIKFADAATPLSGDYSAADPDYRLKTAVSARSLYMATDKGVMALEQASSTVPRLSGIAEALIPTATVIPDPTSPVPIIPGFLDNSKAVAYRVLFGYVDSHNAVHLGPPSVRVTCKNASGGQASVNVFVPLSTAPTDVTGTIVSGTFVRVYRSVMANTEALTSDELYLVSETVIDTTAYNTGDALNIADNTEQDFAVQSAPLYTNPTQGGLPNDPPPFARDLANWDSRLWYANTEQPYALTAQLIGVEGGGNPDLPATGLRVGDTLTIAGVVFTAATATDFSLRKFKVWDATGSPQGNISLTLWSLHDLVNRWATIDPSFAIRAYLEPVVFGDQLLNFKVRFQRPSADSTTNTTFRVVYAVAKSSFIGIGAPSGGQQEISITSALDLNADDWVQVVVVLPSGSAGTYTVKVNSVLGSNVYVDSTTLPSGPAVSGLIRRAYAESVWTPALSAGVDAFWTPSLEAGVAADNERQDNGLYYSLPNEPEAVSAASYLTVGTSGRAIKRIVPQRDRLLVFKEEGTYAVYGDFPYQVSLIDDTVQILAPDSAVALGSTVFVLTDDGILAITDGGIQMVSKAIDSTLKPYLASTGRNLTAPGAFGVSYESEKVFALFMPALGISGYEAKAYVYGLESGAWTTWTFGQPRTCGKVDPFTDTAYYGTTATPYLYKDKNTSSTADYFDSTGPIVSTVQWAATTLGAPYATKQARELHLHYRDLRRFADALQIQYSVKTDIVPAGQSINAWEDAAPPGPPQSIGAPVLPLQFRKLIPQNVQRATYYTLGLSASSVAPGNYWALNGYSIVYEGTSERTGTVR